MLVEQRSRTLQDPTGIREAVEGDGLLERLDHQLDTPGVLRHRRERPAQRLFVRLLHRPAVGTGDDLTRVRSLAVSAESQDPRRSGGKPMRRPRLDAAQDHVLRPDADAITRDEVLRDLDGHSVAPPQVLEGRAVSLEDDPSVAARYERILDRHFALLAATNVGNALSE